MSQTVLARLIPRRDSVYWGQLALERLHRLFAIIIVLQLIQCFGDFWWDETYSVAYGTLIIAGVCELAFTRWYALRIGLAAVAAVLFSAVYSPSFSWTGWPTHWRSQAEWQLFTDSHIVPLHPFAELAIGAVLAVHLLAWIGRTQGAMLGILFLSIAVMASVDSFFPFELWHNIAWIVCAGLGWLVVLHLRQLRSRHPDSWEALAERPLDLAFPAILVITLLIVSGIIMPRAPALLEDPYTIWSEAQGREVPSFAGEGGVIVGSTLNVSKSGSSASGYSRDDSNIGGGFNFDYSPVMTVSTSRRSYWRGETKSEYTGTGWEDLRGSNQRNLVPVPADGQAALEALPKLADGVQTEKVTQTVTMLRKDRVPVLFAAGAASLVTGVESPDSSQLLWNPQDWELRWNRPARVDSYIVESTVTMLDRAGLRQVAAPDPATASIDVAPYLQLPESLPDRVRQLAAEVTANGTNTYDKLDSLEKYLKNTYPYNNQPDVSKQQSADVTDAFLFEIKEGYCDYYSTAFVVMARTLGVPARWVKGYASGFDPNDVDQLRFSGVLEDPDGPGTFTVRNADAHSWAEVYFEGYGWIPFEPTSGFTVPLPVPADALPELSLDPAAAETDVAAQSEGNGFGLWVPIAGGALLVLIVAAFLLRKRNDWSLWERIRSVGASPEQRIVREMERLLRFMRRRGLTREDNETMRETFQRWGDKFASLRTDFEGILVRFERAKYGRDTGGETGVKDFEAAVHKLRKAL